MHPRATFLLLIFFSFVLAAASAPTQVILLPEMLAVELPAPELKEIAPNASPMKELLEAARADGFKVTHDRNDPLPLGRTVVTWTAWEGEAGNSAVRAKKSAPSVCVSIRPCPRGDLAGRSRDSRKPCSKN